MAFGMNNEQMFGGAAALGGLGNYLSYQNPADSAMPYLNQIPGMMQQYLNPYIQNGLNAGNTLNTQFGEMLKNPGGFMNQMGKNFQQSPGYQFQVGQATNAANNAAAAGGYTGSPQEQLGLAQNVSGLANQDYYNWINHTMNLYGQGVQGEQNIYQTGAGASSNLAESIAQAMMSQANLAYAGTANQDQNQGGSIGAMLGGSALMFGI